MDESLQAYIRRTVDQAPPLSTEQREKLAAILGKPADTVSPAMRVDLSA